MELSAKVVMIVLGLEAWGRVGQPRSRAGREELAGRKFALRTGLPGPMPWQFILVLGCLHWGYYNKSQHCWSTLCVPGPVCALSPVILRQPQEVGTYLCSKEEGRGVARLGEFPSAHINLTADP